MKVGVSTRTILTSVNAFLATKDLIVSMRSTSAILSLVRMEPRVTTTWAHTHVSADLAFKDLIVNTILMIALPTHAETVVSAMILSMMSSVRVLMELLVRCARLILITATLVLVIMEAHALTKLEVLSAAVEKDSLVPNAKEMLMSASQTLVCRKELRIVFSLLMISNVVANRVTWVAFVMQKQRFIFVTSHHARTEVFATTCNRLKNIGVLVRIPTLANSVSFPLMRAATTLASPMRSAVHTREATIVDTAPNRASATIILVFMEVPAKKCQMVITATAPVAIMARSAKRRMTAFSKSNVGRTDVKKKLIIIFAIRSVIILNAVLMVTSVLLDVTPGPTATPACNVGRCLATVFATNSATILIAYMMV